MSEMTPRELANEIIDKPLSAANDLTALAEHYLDCLNALEKIEAGIGNANQVASMVLEHIRGD